MRRTFVLIAALTLAMQVCRTGLTAESDNVNRWAIAVETNVPGNLYYGDDPAHAQVVASPKPSQEVQVNVTVQVLDVTRKKVTEFASIILNQDNEFAAVVNLPGDPGFYYLELKANGGQRSVTASSRYAVIPSNPAMDRREPESPFGVNTHFNQWNRPRIGRIVKRAGIGWIRDGEAGPDDRAAPVAKADKLCYMPCFTRWTASIPAKMKEALARGEAVGADWDFGEEVEWHRRYAEKYGAQIDVYDLMNEPHGHWGAVLGGSWNGGDWLKMFAVYGRQVTDAIQQADPGAKVLWEDIDQLLWYKQWPKLGVADKIAYISPHSYNLHRSAPLPEQQFIIAGDQFKPFREFCRQNELPWKVWAGEVGFSSFQRTQTTPTPFYTSNTETPQAEKLVRMMVLQLYAGMEKIFWYDFQNDGRDPHNPEHNFGLITYDELPKPGLAAYANLIHRLRGSRWYGRYATPGEVCETLAFTPLDSPTSTLIAWARDGAQDQQLLLKTDVPEVNVTDIYGRSRRLVTENGVMKLPLGPSPVYVEGLKEKDITSHPGWQSRANRES